MRPLTLASVALAAGHAGGVAYRSSLCLRRKALLFLLHSAAIGPVLALTTAREHRGGRQGLSSLLRPPAPALDSTPATVILTRSDSRRHMPPWEYHTVLGAVTQCSVQR